MSKRKAAATSVPAKRAKPDQQQQQSENEADVMLQRAMEMQEEDLDDSDEDQEDSEEEDAASDADFSEVSEQDAAEKQETGQLETEVVAVQPSKSSADKVTSILKKSRCLSPTASHPLLNSLQDSLRHLKSVLESVPAVAGLSPAEARKKYNCVKFPGSAQSLAEVQWKVSYEQPLRINVVGYWPAGLALKSQGKFTVDLAVEMPESLFTEKDIKDFRYHSKRAFYLAVIQTAFQKDAGLNKVFDIQLSSDELSPVLQLSEQGYTINVIPTIPATLFQPSKLGSDRNNIRSSSAPTPLYNAAILADTLPFDDLLIFHRAASKSASVGDTARLVQLWTRARQLTNNVQHFLIYFLLYLVDVKGVLAASPNALFLTLLEWVVREDFAHAVGWKDSLDAAKKVSGGDKGVFGHPTGRLNLLSGTIEPVKELIKVEAGRTIAALNRNTAADADAVFLNSASKLLIPLEAQYDLVLFTSLSSAHVQQLAEQWATEQPDITALPLQVLHQRMHYVLRRALGTRVKAIHLTPFKPAADGSVQVHIALLYQPAEATRLVDHGPAAADESACQAFRDFWGSRSELRRFKDGSIVEACVWEVQGVLSRFTVPEQIARYILNHKFNVEEFESATSGFHEMVQEPATWRQRLYQADPESKGFSAIMQAYEELSSALRSMESLPLAIKNVSPVSEQLRYASAFVPGARKTKQFFQLPEVASFVDVADVIITFEQSGKWPTDLQAIQKVKIAFLAKVAEALEKSLSHVQCTTALDGSASAEGDNVSLEVLLPSGFAFRLHVFHETEMALLGQASFDQPSLTEVLQQHRRRFVLQPKHHAAFASLIHQYPALSGTTRLVKRWVAAHLLSPHVSLEQLELLCAHVFLRGSPPGSPLHGFLAVLHLLATWTWWSDPLLIPLFSASKREGSALDASSIGRQVEFPADKAVAAHTSFSNARQADPAMNNGGSWFIATEDDLTSRWWGWSKPSRMVGTRVKDLALASLQAVHDRAEPATLFSPPTSVFDFTLDLKVSKVTRQHQSLHAQAIVGAKSTTPTPSSLRIPVGLDAARQFVREAQEAIGDAAALFYDEFGGTTVYGLFNPLLDKSRPWAPTLDFPARPAGSTDESESSRKNSSKKKKAMVVLDKTALLGDLVRMSRGLVGSISQS